MHAPHGLHHSCAQYILFSGSDNVIHTSGKCFLGTAPCPETRLQTQLMQPRYPGYIPSPPDLVTAPGPPFLTDF